VVAKANFKRTLDKGYIYIKVYKYAVDTTETLLATSSTTAKINKDDYIEYNVSAILPATEFLATDRIVVKIYANADGGGNSNLTMQVE